MNGIKIALSLLILASWVCPVEAAQVIHFQLPQLVHHSNFIVHGQIQDVRAMRSSEAPGRIQRVVRVATKEVLKRDTQHSQAKTVSFVMAGGRMGRFRQFVPGLPSIQGRRPGCAVLASTHSRRCAGTDRHGSGSLCAHFTAQRCHDSQKRQAGNPSDIEICRWSFVPGSSERSFR